MRWRALGEMVGPAASVISGNAPRCAEDDAPGVVPPVGAEVAVRTLQAGGHDARHAVRTAAERQIAEAQVSEADLTLLPTRAKPR